MLRTLFRYTDTWFPTRITDKRSPVLRGGNYWRRPRRTQRRTGAGQVPLVVEVKIDREAPPGNLVGALAALLVERARKAVEARGQIKEKEVGK